MTPVCGEWVVLRRRVSLGGRVLRSGGEPVAGGTVRLAAACATPAPMAAPVLVTAVRRGGVYFYLDLPPGLYTVEAHDQSGRPSDSKPVAVPVADHAAWSPLMAVHLTVARAGGAA